MPPWARTWIEHWPAGLQALSFPQRSVRLGEAEAEALRLRNAGFGGAQPVLDALARRLDRELALLGAAAFVRLGSGSAKDTAVGVVTGCRADEGAAALRLLTAGSRRVSLDLRRAVAHRLAPCIHLRTWQEIPWWSEFRCFLRDGQLAGVSQYHALQPWPDAVRPRLPAMHRAIEALAARIVQAWGPQPVVADVMATGAAAATLIELNPWSSATDPCLFSWTAEDFDGSLRLQDAPAADGWL